MKRIFILLLVTLMCITLAACGQGNGEENDNSYIEYEVLSGSMEPIFEIGKTVYFEKVDVETLKVGDIILFETSIRDEEMQLAHRIVEITEEDGELRFITQGDKNSIPDLDLIDGNRVLGKLVED